MAPLTSSSIPMWPGSADDSHCMASSPDSERAGHFSIVGAVYRAAEHNFAAQETVLELVALAVRERPRFLDNWNETARA